MISPPLALGVLLSLGAILTLAQERDATEKQLVANQQVRPLGRGINLGNALDAPNEGNWGVILKCDYFRTIREAGFETVRLPVRWSAHAGAEAPYTLDPNFAARVDWAIDQALANGLNIIVDFHHYEELNADPDKHLPRFNHLWEQIAARYKDRPVGVYFELLNEPHNKLSEDKWNATIPRALAAVRKTNPIRPVIVGPARWNAIEALDKLELPEDDRALIVTVHWYEPFEFTHQGAAWVPGADKWKGRKWVGSDAQRSVIHDAFGRAAAWARSHGRPAFLGEFGVIQAADMESRARWTRFVVREAEKQGFGWAYWEWCSEFGAYDTRAKVWRTPLKAALVDP
jgi:endoglucanase